MAFSQCAHGHRRKPGACVWVGASFSKLYVLALVCPLFDEVGEPTSPRRPVRAPDGNFAGRSYARCAERTGGRPRLVVIARLINISIPESMPRWGLHPRNDHIARGAAPSVRGGHKCGMTEGLVRFHYSWAR